MDKALIAAFDVGTTATKGILLDARGAIVAQGEAGYPTYHGAGTIEQAPDEWWAAVCAVAQGFWRDGHSPDAVAGVALTGQMQDVVPVDGARRALGRAILYSDARAEAGSAAVRAALEAAGSDPTEVAAVDAASPLAKVAWLAAHDPERLAACERILFGAKDYALARLSGVCATDATTAGTTACLDLPRQAWRTGWWKTLGLTASWLPDLLPAGAVAGHVRADAAAETGFVAGTPVATGMGDAAAATLAAGLTAPGGAYLYLGTSAWAATVVAADAGSSHGRDEAGLFYLPYLADETLIAAAPLLNAGSAHQWIMDLLGFRDADIVDGAFDYAGFERLLQATPERSGGVLFLPYLNGERCPVPEARSLGTFLRMGARTGRGNLAWAVLEGIGFSLRQVLETLGVARPEVRLVGGGARSAAFRQVVAATCGVTVRAPALPSAGNALAAAVPLAVTLGWFPRVEDAVAAWFPTSGTEAVLPEPQWAEHYAALYDTYRRIYPLVSQLER